MTYLPVKIGKLRKDGLPRKTGWKAPRITQWDIWNKVSVGLPEDCWLWNGWINKTNGYGYVTYQAVNHRAHRLIYQLYHGVILTRDTHLLHSCDVKHCCNPHHLREGDHAANMQDAVDRLRMFDPVREKLQAAGNTTVSSKAFARRTKRLGWSEQEALNTPILPTGVARGQIIRKR